MRQSGGNQYDTLIKDLFADGTEELVNYFSDLEISLVGDLRIEFPQVETRISDLVLEAVSDRGPLAVHLEFQSRNDREMPYRMLRYALEIHKTYRLPVYQLVIYFGRWEMNMNDTLSYHLGAANLLNYRYQLIDVGKISYEELKNSPYQQLRSLLPLRMSRGSWNLRWRLPALLWYNRVEENKTKGGATDVIIPRAAYRRKEPSNYSRRKPDLRGARRENPFT